MDRKTRDLFKMLLHTFISMIFFTTEDMHRPLCYCANKQGAASRMQRKVRCTVHSAIVQINCNSSSHDCSIVGFEEELLKVIPPSLILDERKGAIS